MIKPVECVCQFCGKKWTAHTLGGYVRNTCSTCRALYCCCHGGLHTQSDRQIGTAICIVCQEPIIAGQIYRSDRNSSLKSHKDCASKWNETHPRTESVVST